MGIFGLVYTLLDFFLTDLLKDFSVSILNKIFQYYINRKDTFQSDHPMYYTEDPTSSVISSTTV